MISISFDNQPEPGLYFHYGIDAINYYKTCFHNSQEKQFSSGKILKTLTMKEIASLAGVSATTVSRVFHSPHKVNEETLKRVRRITEEHNYIYNAAAGSLSSRRSRVIGALIPKANRSFFSESLIAIQDRASTDDYSVISGNTNYDPATERNLLQQFRQHQISGLIVAGYDESNLELLKSITAAGVPTVIIWEQDDNPAFSNAGFDNLYASYSVTEYLISLGHRRIGLISGPASGINRVCRRRDGYRRALEDNGLIFEPELAFEREPLLSEGKEALKTLMSRANPPSAVFAASDTLAIGAMAGARELGLAVPGDISIAGFDDIDVAAYSSPPLTSVRVPAREMGLKAVEIILEAAENPDFTNRHYCLSTELVIRESCSGPAAHLIKMT